MFCPRHRYYLPFCYDCIAVNARREQRVTIAILIALVVIALATFRASEPTPITTSNEAADAR